ncbi:twin-arginine translocation pathway signal [Oceanicola sp. 22II-s10i]|uniref:lipid-binding SYLF domain-containing protein n=1 Tax=Oceanicola sp. 22II-s10i TaxID=1317116 RepID=UPI000B528CE6|nr:YSC84-related protein [Oceanicola sp. 22II-s10i]OWU83538.1 twin-arginine translocation pathway signal [Oceanicola sp. 22II-s10i]
MSGYTRRTFSFAALAALPLLAACGNGPGSTGGQKIDARVDATINYMHQQFPQTLDLTQKSVGMLVMPLQTEVGFGIGGTYGRGALRVNGATVDYYSSTAANIGLQVGAQQYAHVLFFMTQEALDDFRHSYGWALGADVEYVFSDKGETLRAESNTGLSPIVAIVFGQAGLKIGASLEGVKYNRIIP